MKIVAAFLLGFVSCGKSPVTARILPSTTVGQALSVFDAEDQINTRLGARWVAVDPDGEYRIVFGKFFPSCGPDGTEYAGCTDTLTKVIALDDSELDYKIQVNVAIHEFGHALGLQHSKDPDDIMYPEVQAESYTDRAWRRFAFSLGVRR